MKFKIRNIKDIHSILSSSQNVRRRLVRNKKSMMERIAKETGMTGKDGRRLFYDLDALCDFADQLADMEAEVES